MNADRRYQAIMAAPFGKLGIACSETALLRLDFLPPQMATQTADSPLAQTVVGQLADWLIDPDWIFSLPLAACGTAHQNRVWQAISAIPRGQVLTYGELARQIGSAARAVGQACGANPWPLIVPCHRVVACNGQGGFMQQTDAAALSVKHWLQQHERY